MENPKRCTDSLQKALGYVDEFIYGDKSIKLAKDITKHVFSLGKPLHRHSFSIKCYVTNNFDIRFCIDRGSDCSKPRTMTNFLVIRPPSEIHVIDSGKPYLRPQTTTKFHIISTHDALELSCQQICAHINNSFCSRIKQYSLQSSLCK
jgi:hypothetical protein